MSTLVVIHLWFLWLWAKMTICPYSGDTLPIVLMCVTLCPVCYKICPTNNSEDSVGVDKTCFS